MTRSLTVENSTKDSGLSARSAVHTDMQITLPFQGTQAEGIVKIKQMIQQHQKEIQQNATDVKMDWQENVLTFAFTAQGKSISGTLTVKDNEFDVYAKLPLMYRMFEGTIEKMIKSEIEKRLIDLETWKQVIGAKAGMAVAAIVGIWTLLAPTIRGALGISNG